MEGSAKKPDLQGVQLARRETKHISELPEFRQATHRVPTKHDPQAQAFVNSLGGQWVRDDLDRMFFQLRAAFRFRRTEIVTDETNDGAGCITTPLFRYSCCVYQDPRNPEQVVWQRDVANIRSIDNTTEPQFDHAFDELFDTIEFFPNGTIDLIKLVDHIEDKDDARVQLEYDRQLTRCDIRIQACDAIIQATAEALRIIHASPTSATTLVESFFAVQNALTNFSQLVCLDGHRPTT